MPVLSLANNKNKQNITYSKKLSRIEIHYILKHYKKIDNSIIPTLPKGEFICYFTKRDNDKYIFGIGGFLYNKDPYDSGFIVLRNGNLKWCVQLANSILFIKKTTQEIENNYKLLIEKQQQYIDNLMDRRIKNIKQKPSPPKLSNYQLLNDRDIMQMTDMTSFFLYEIETEKITECQFSSYKQYKNIIVLLYVIKDGSPDVKIDPSKYWFYTLKIDHRKQNVYNLVDKYKKYFVKKHRNYER